MMKPGLFIADKVFNAYEQAVDFLIAANTNTNENK